MNDDRNTNQYTNDQDEFLNLNQDDSQHDILDLSSFNNANNNQENSSQLSNNQFINSKKFCHYCNKKFAHQGSYGRHLDLKKGDKLHPLDEINKIRSNVIRRGNGPMIQKKVKNKPKIIITNEDDSKEKNKIRRKLRDRQIKSKLAANEWFLNQFGKYKEAENDNFAKLITMYLPISKLPYKHPDNESYELLMYELTDTTDNNNNNLTLIDKINSSFKEWNSLSDAEKQNIWSFEYKNALDSIIGRFSLNQLQNIKQSIQNKELAYFNDICRKDNLLNYINPTNDQINNQVNDDNDGHDEELQSRDSPNQPEEFNTYFQ